MKIQKIFYQRDNSAQVISAIFDSASIAMSITHYKKKRIDDKLYTTLEYEQALKEQDLQLAHSVPERDVQEKEIDPSRKEEPTVDNNTYKDREREREGKLQDLIRT